MKLSEILEHIDVMVDNNLTVDFKISLLNQIQRQLFRKLRIPEQVLTLQTIPQVAFYALPNNVAPETIKSPILVGGVAYYFQDWGEEASDRFWSIVEGQLFLYPTPTEVKTITIVHVPRHVDLKSSDLDAEPSLPADYHHLLVRWCCADVAKAMGKVDLANNFTADRDELLFEALRDLNRTPGPRRIRASRWT